jgi:pilus assembly protein FimV
MALLSLTGTEVLALSLGRITVQSALGEPLRAEIDVPDINAEEAASLKTGVAAPEAFTAAGLEYNAAMTGMQVVLSRRSDGRAFIKLTSQRNINEPYVDMIIEASWSSGRIVRDYTMLFDPPSLKQTPPTPTLPQTVAPAPVAAKASPVEPVRTGPASKPAPVAPTAATPAKTPAKQESSGGQQVTVKPGDTASKIANASKASDVSLDQMLVALMRSNPDAFSNGNINRLRAGAVLDLPTADQAKSVGTAQATQMVIAQSKDFNEFRRKLATDAPKASVEASDRQASGKVAAKVDDKKASSTTPDKLTLSKGAVKSTANDAKLAKELADKDAAARAAELAKNIADLKKVGSATAAPAAAAQAAASQAKPSSTPSVAVATTPAAPAKPAASTPLPAMPASAPASPASNPAMPASAPAKPKPAAVAPPIPVEEPSIVGELLADPVIPAAGAGLLALLGGFAFYRQRQNKKKAAHVDSSFLESRLQPDSFFGASGGQRVDTGNEGAPGASSMVYSASQLDAADDVDPVAEADVYLAYGRDVQAEEILKEAIKHNPGRLAIHTKLLEIFAKRRDAGNFQATATHAFKLVGGDSPEWARICEMGLGIDPTNPLYQPGGATLSAFGTLESAPAPISEAASTVAMSTSGELASGGGAMDLDLDLDFSADDVPAKSGIDIGTSTPEVHALEDTVKLQAQAPSQSNSLDFDISGVGELSATPASNALPDISMSMDGLNLSAPTEISALEMPDFVPTGTMTPEPVAEATSPKPADGMLEFDLGSLSLDLDSVNSSSDESIGGEDPLETKLALAEEFVSIGDSDGARALIEEVVAEASGELRAKAQRALANLT